MQIQRSHTQPPTPHSTNENGVGTLGGRVQSLMEKKSYENKIVEMGSHPTVSSDSRTKNDARRVRNVMGPLQTPKKTVKK